MKMMMTIKMITTMILLIMIITQSVLVFMCQTVLLTV